MSLFFDSEVYEYSVKMSKSLLKSLGRYQVWKRLNAIEPCTFANLRRVINQYLYTNPVLLLSVLTDRIMSLNDFIEKFSKQFYGLAITGYLGTGKTDFSLLIYQKLREKNPDLLLVTNMKSLQLPNYRVCDTNEDLENFLTKQKGQKFFIFDEAGVITSIYESVFKRHIKTFSRNMVYLRKWNSCFCFVLPQFEALNKAVRRYIKVVVTKLSTKTASVQFANEYFPYVILNIPKTDIVFDTLEVASWQQDEEDDISKEE